jgi:histidine transport system permease protein
MFNLQGYGPQIFAGMITTVELSLLSLFVSFALGLLGASAKLSKNKVLRGAATVYTTIIRGVPDLVLMLLIFYSLQIWINDFTDYLDNIQNSIDFEIQLDPFTSGVITLGFIYGAYFTETFRGAFMAVPRGQLEAARSFGMKPGLVFGLGNNWQVILKATALVYLIGLTDIIKAAQNAGEATFQTFFFYSIAGLVYLFLTTISNGVLMLLARKYAVGVRKAVL